MPLAVPPNFIAVLVNCTQWVTDGDNCAEQRVRKVATKAGVTVCSSSLLMAHSSQLRTGFRTA